jgi:hypothetical protein
VSTASRFAKYKLTKPKFPGIIKGFGPVGVGLTAGDLIQGDNGDTGGVRDYLGNAARYAGIGGTLGSFFGPGGAAIGAVGGGLFGLGYEFFDPDSDKIVEGSVPLPPNNRLTLEDLAAEYDKYFGSTGGGGGGAAASALGEQELQILRNYWNTLNQYGTNRAQALNEMFSGVSAARARAGQAVERGGTNLAADIENLYSRLGAQASQPMMAPGSPTAGLAPVSGPAATAAQTIGSEGGNLADFLASATGSEARNIYDIASAQALQGAGMTQGFLDMLTMAKQEQLARQRSINAQRVAQANAAAAANASAARDARNRFLFEAQAGLLAQSKADQDAEWAIIYTQATDKEAYKKMEKLTKPMGLTPLEFVRQNPDRVGMLLPNEQG